MNSLKGVPVFFLILILASCGTSRKMQNYQLSQIPPGTTKVSDNFFCDQIEMTNMGWREYQTWIEKVYGKESEEYIAAKPDTIVWRDLKCPSAANEDSYFRYPVYCDYPLVGISQQQAVDYSKWRSDRVFERILVNSGKLKWDNAQTKDTHFTIERYFAGTLSTIVPGDKFMYYPEYRLPSLTERKLILRHEYPLEEFVDSLEELYADTCISKYRRNQKKNSAERYIEIYCSDYIRDEADDATPRFGMHVKNYISDLRGNVSEWTMEPGISVGGSFCDTKERILQNDIFMSETPKSWIGFRNVCQWKHKDEFNKDLWQIDAR